MHSRANPLQAFAVVAAALAVVIIPVMMFAAFFPRKEPVVPVTINKNIIRATLADSPEERTQGLSGTDKLRDGSGMLFVWEESGYWAIWMKDMKYSIDIIWLNEEKSIVTIKEQADPKTYPKSFSPSVPAKYVLEVPSGTVSQHSIKLGDKAEFTIKQ